jgi:hypothetical protein
MTSSTKRKQEKGVHRRQGMTHDEGKTSNKRRKKYQSPALLVRAVEASSGSAMAHAYGSPHRTASTCLLMVNSLAALLQRTHRDSDSEETMAVAVTVTVTA